MKSDGRQELIAFLGREEPPLRDRQITQADVHDAETAKCLDSVSERRAHATNLPVAPFRQRDPERGRIHFLRPARPGLFSQHQDPLLQLFQKGQGYGRSTVTTYSRSWPNSARRMRLTMSPSLVSRIKPEESLSRRPMGKMRSG